MLQPNPLCWLKIGLPSIIGLGLMVFTVVLYREMKTLITAMLLGSAVWLQAADWPNWRGPDHNGISQETDWFEKWGSSGPKRLWNTSVGTGSTAVSVADGRVFTTLCLEIRRLAQGCPKGVLKTGDFDFTFLAIPRRLRRVGTWNLPRCRFQHFPRPLTPLPFCWHNSVSAAIIRLP
jgi:hypothetical protein